MERSHSCSNFEGPQAEASPASGVHKPHAGSSDNLPKSIAASSMAHFPPNKPLRKRRKLQRQQSVIVDDTECECAYAADLEEDAEPDAAEEPLIMPRLPGKHFEPHVRHVSCSSGGSSQNGRCLRHEESFDSCSTAPELSPQAVRQHRFSSLLLRDSSVSMQSDSSRYSSVDSLLESRKPDPEAILINLGFGPVGTEDMLSRIPKRFLKPSKVPGIDTEAFVKRLQLASSLADSSALGYRGLTSSSDQPPSSIVAKIMERFEVNNQRKQSMGHIEHTIR